MSEYSTENGPTQPAIFDGQDLNESEAAANYNGSLLREEHVEAPFEGPKLNESEIKAGIDGSFIVGEKVEATADAPVVNESEVNAGLTDEKPADESTAPEGTVDEVLAWVGDDTAKAKTALDAETAGKNRASLVNKLKAVG